MTIVSLLVVKALIHGMNHISSINKRKYSFKFRKEVYVQICTINY